MSRYKTVKRKQIRSKTDKINKDKFEGLKNPHKSDYLAHINI